MIRVAFRNLAATKLRFALTALSIVLGVAFVTGSFVLADSLRVSVDKIFDQAAGASDLVVRAPEGPTGDQPNVPLATVSQVEAVDGVSAAVARAGGNGALSVDGETSGVSISNWVGTPELTPFSLTSGQAPQAAREVVLDESTADANGVDVGETVLLRGDGPAEQYTVVGLSTLSDAAGDALPFAFLGLEETLAVTGEDGLTEVGVAIDAGADQAAIATAIGAAVPGDVEVVDGTAAVADGRAEVQDTVGLLGNALLGFAIVAVFVGGLIVLNTFSITFNQRRRQLALLRAVGASGGQVTRSLVAEAVAVGLAASAVGLAAGLGLASGLEWLLGAAGAPLPNTDMVLETRTVAVALALGLGLAVTAAVLPARRASTVAPVAALRDDGGAQQASGAVGVVIGVALAAVAGGALVLSGPIASTTLSLALIGVGAVATLVSAALLAPVVVPVLTRVIGAPLGLMGVPGRLGRGNAARDPKRTAATAAALMIGLALISVAGVFAASAKATLTEQVDSRLRGDVIISPDEPLESVPSAVAARIAQREDVTDVGVASYAEWSDGDDVREVAIVDPVVFDRVYDAQETEGALTDLAPGGVILDEDLAGDLGVGVGDLVPMLFEGGSASVRVDALMSDQIFGAAVIHVADQERWTPEAQTVFLVAAGRDGAEPSELASAIEGSTADFPGVLVQDRDEFVAAQNAAVDQVLTLIYALLGLTGVIAVAGIVNTLSLSVLERTREIGLLRAVGLTGRQAKRMIRAESVLISLIGAALGLAVGVGLGVLVSAETPLIEVVSIPWGQVALYAGIAALAGVLAAIWPARRAARLDVLRAITTE